MIRYITLVFVLLQVNIHCSNAQLWANPENRWHVDINCLGPQPFGGSEVRAYFLKDTLRQNGEVYLQMHETLDTTFQTSTPTGTYYREEDNKVYSLEPGRPERLIYDFNLTAGDTLTVAAGFIDLPIKVVSMDSVILRDGTKRKRLAIQQNSPFARDTAFWVEGIGSSLTPFHTWNMFISDCGSSLSCFYQKDSLLYKFDENSICNLGRPIGDPVNVQEISALASIKVFPNPFSDDLYVDVELMTGFLLNHNYTLIISDAQGRQLYQHKLNQINNFRINTTHWQRGVYFVAIWSGNRISSRKLLKK